MFVRVWALVNMKIFTKLLLRTLKVSLRRSWLAHNKVFSSLGIVKFELAFDRNEVVALKREVDRLIEEGRYNWEDQLGSDKRIYEANTKSKLFHEFLKSRQINAFVSENGFVNSHNFLLASRVDYVEGNLGSGGGWHRDSVNPQIKAFLYLSDVGSEHGPFQYLQGSGRLMSKILLALRHGRSIGALRYKATEESGTVDEILGKCGDLVFANTSAIHRGKPLESSTRYMLTVYFFETEGEKRSFLDSLASNDF